MKIIHRVFIALIALTLLTLVGCGPSAKEIAEEKHKLEMAEAKRKAAIAAEEAERKAAIAAEEARRIALQQDCEKLDNEQRRLNEGYSRWKSIYPLSSSALISCTKSAKNNDDVGKCMATACVMASMGAGSTTNEGCVDFGSRLTAIGTANDALKTRKRSLPSCTFTVPNDMNE